MRKRVKDRRSVRTTAGFGQSSPMYRDLNFFFYGNMSMIRVTRSSTPSGERNRSKQRKTKGDETRGSRSKEVFRMNTTEIQRQPAETIKQSAWEPFAKKFRPTNILRGGRWVDRRRRCLRGSNIQDPISRLLGNVPASKDRKIRRREPYTYE